MRAWDRTWGNNHEKGRIFAVLVGVVIGGHSVTASDADALTYRDKTLDQWMSVLDTKGPFATIEVAVRISEMNQKIKNTLPALLKTLPKQRGLQRTMVAKAIADIGPDKISLEVLQTEMERDGDGRIYLIKAIGRLGVHAKSAIPVLKRVYAAECTTQIKVGIVVALWEITNDFVVVESYIKVLLENGFSDDASRAHVPEELLKTIQEIGLPAKSLIKPLREFKKGLADESVKSITDDVINSLNAE